MRFCRRSCWSGFRDANLLRMTSHFFFWVALSLSHSEAIGVSACCCAGVNSAHNGFAGRPDAGFAGFLPAAADGGATAPGFMADGTPEALPAIAALAAM